MINIIRIVKSGDERKNNIQETAKKILDLNNKKRSSMNQAIYTQKMEKEIKEYKTNRKITIEELKSHTNENDCWIAYNGKVYDITKYLEFHPGGMFLLKIFFSNSFFRERNFT